MKIGIIGLGFVGTAIKLAYAKTDVELVLIDPAKGYHHSYEDLMSTDAVFVSVPSPQSDDGSCDTSILENVLDKLWEMEYPNVIISKVTAPPSVYDMLQDKHLNLVHAPEFLTAVNANEDYANGTFLILGGKSFTHLQMAEDVIRIGQEKIKTDVHYCQIGEASMAKYVINCWLATKVIFMNEINNLALAHGYNYNNIRDAFILDKRIGTSHTQVPGPDGEYGFGGYCFPKDTSALLHHAEGMNVDLTVLQTAVFKNNAIRK